MHGMGSSTVPWFIAQNGFFDQALNSLKPFRAHIMLLCWEVSDYSNVTEGDIILIELLMTVWVCKKNPKTKQNNSRLAPRRARQRGRQAWDPQVRPWVISHLVGGRIKGIRVTKLCGNMCYVFIGAITGTLAFRHAGEQQQSRKSDLLMNADSTFKRLTSDILNLKKWRGSPWGFGRRHWPPRWFGARESEPRRSLRDWPARRWALRGTPRQNEPGMNRGAQIWGCGVLAKWGEEGEERVGGKKKKKRDDNNNTWHTSTVTAGLRGTQTDCLLVQQKIYVRIWYKTFRNIWNVIFWYCP